MKRLEEEEIMQECMEAMIEDEMFEAELEELQRKRFVIQKYKLLICF